MKTLLALLLLIPSLSWGSDSYFGCKLIARIDHVGDNVEDFVLSEAETELMNINLEKGIIVFGKLETEYMILNTSETHITAYKNISTKIDTYISLNRYTLSMNSKNKSKKDDKLLFETNWICNPIEKKI